jgi:hypothetical protein
VDQTTKDKLIKAAGSSPSLAALCLSAGVRLSVLKAAMRDDSDFAVAVKDGLANAQGAGEIAVFKYGVEGYDEPVLHRGEQVPMRDPETGEVKRDSNGDPVFHSVRKIDAKLTTFYLKSVDPELYGSLHGGSGGGPTVQKGDGKQLPMFLDRLTPEQFGQFSELLDAVTASPEEWKARGGK